MCFPDLMASGAAMRSDRSHGDCVTVRLRGAANAAEVKASSSFLNGVMIQEATKALLALDMPGERWSLRIVNAQRNNIADSLMRALVVMMVLDCFERTAQVWFTQQHQIVERFADFSYMSLRKGIA